MTLPAVFETYLLTKGSSKVTVKNYLSDLNHFLGWLELSLKSQNLPFSSDEPEYLTRYFNFFTVNKYRNFLGANNLPVQTINRRLSTLRNLASLAISQGWIKENPLNQIQNAKVKNQNHLENTSNPEIPNTKYQIAALPTNRQNTSEDILSGFKTSLEKEKTSGGRSTSPNTIKNYLSDIREFLNWLEAEKVI